MNPSIYLSSEQGEILPVTVNFDWTPEGCLEPKYFWQDADDIRCKVEHVYEHEKIKSMKGGGDGIRFKVRARVVGQDDDRDAFDERQQFITYITLARDDGFFDKPIVDERYDNPHKAYVKVNLNWMPDDTLNLCYFWWIDGNRYKVEEEHGHKRIASQIAGGVGIRYKVTVRLDTDGESPEPGDEKMRCIGLYLEVMRWFAEVV